MDGTDLTVITGAVQCQCCRVVFTYVQCSAVQCMAADSLEYIE